MIRDFLMWKNTVMLFTIPRRFEKNQYVHDGCFFWYYEEF